MRVYLRSRVSVTNAGRCHDSKPPNPRREGIGLEIRWLVRCQVLRRVEWGACMYSHTLRYGREEGTRLRERRRDERKLCEVHVKGVRHIFFSNGGLGCQREIESYSLRNPWVYSVAAVSSMVAVVVVVVAVVALVTTDVVAVALDVDVAVAVALLIVDVEVTADVLVVEGASPLRHWSTNAEHSLPSVSVYQHGGSFSMSVP